MPTLELRELYIVQDIRQIKQAVRRTMEQRRAEAMSQSPDAASLLEKNFLDEIDVPDHSIVAGYSRQGSEMDTATLMCGLYDRGATLALPVIDARKKPLIFRLYAPGDPLAPGAMMNILEPLPTAPVVTPSVLLVPLLAFDARGQRLGYGGGYYDRTINGLRQQGAMLAIGLAFSCQEVPDVPTGFHDARLDMIVTEKGVTRFN